MAAFLGKRCGGHATLSEGKDAQVVGPICRKGRVLGRVGSSCFEDTKIPTRKQPIHAPHALPPKASHRAPAHPLLQLCFGFFQCAIVEQFAQHGHSHGPCPKVEWAVVAQAIGGLMDVKFAVDLLQTVLHGP